MNTILFPMVNNASYCYSLAVESTGINPGGRIALRPIRIRYEITSPLP
jgi:hypothetical protein